MRCKVYGRTDSTNVWGYVDVDVVDADGRSLEGDDWAAHVGEPVRSLCREQYPSASHIRESHLDEVRALLRERGHTVL